MTAQIATLQQLRRAVADLGKRLRILFALAELEADVASARWASGFGQGEAV